MFNVLPVPAWWALLLYFLPSVIALGVIAVHWSRLPRRAPEERRRLRSNLLAATSLVCSWTAIIMTLLRWPDYR